MTAASPFRVSYEEYLVAEAVSDDKHEWCDGAVYAMSTGTLEHARLTANLCRALGNALGKSCTIFGPEAMLFVEAARLSTYADVTVVCGALETKVVRKGGRSLGEAVTNPAVVVEVLSESTERYDRDGKFQAYKQLTSMNEYVLVSQDEPRLEVYRRSVRAGGDGAWGHELAGRGERVTVHGVQIDVDDVYGP